MLYTEAISYLLEGEPARAEPILARALDLATHSGNLPLAGLVLAQQCQLAAQRNSWSEVTSLAQRAVTIVQTGHFDDYWSSAFVYVWAARAPCTRGTSPRDAPTWDVPPGSGPCSATCSPWYPSRPCWR